MSEYDPAHAPRQREYGFKGDGFIVSMPAVPADVSTLLLDTGEDSVAILRVPPAAWDRGDRPLTVHVHERYDETVLIPRGRGTLYHGPDPETIVAQRFESPVTLIFPPGAWHHIVMDADADAGDGTCFFTVSGTVVESFVVQMAIVARGTVTFADREIVHPPRMEPAPSTRPVADGSVRARLVDALPEGASPVARILPFPVPNAQELVLPLDTGADSLFILHSHMLTGKPLSEFVAPETVDVHRHPDVDEYIIRPGGQGYALNGRSPDAVTLTPFVGPCVIVMPAGAYHRIVETETPTGDGILIYAHRRAVVERYEAIMARTRSALVDASAAGGARA